MYNQFDTLNGGTVQRLAYMRGYARTWNADEKKAARGVKRITWRDARSFGKGTIDTDAHGPTYSKTKAAESFRGIARNICANMPASVLEGLRDLGPVDELHRNGRSEFSARFFDHQGWFADAHQDEIYRGQVWQLPTRAGQMQFIGGYVERDSGYAVLCACGERDALETFDSVRDAAIAADHLAEKMAEEAREYSEKWSEASACSDDIAELKEEAKGARENWREFTDMARELKTPSAVARSQGLADNARADHAEFIAQIIAKRERIAQLDMSGEFA